MVLHFFPRVNYLKMLQQVIINPNSMHIKQHVYKHDLLLESVFVLLDNKVATAEFEVLQK